MGNAGNVSWALKIVSQLVFVLGLIFLLSLLASEVFEVEIIDMRPLTAEGFRWLFGIVALSGLVALATSSAFNTQKFGANAVVIMGLVAVAAVFPELNFYIGDSQLRGSVRDGVGERALARRGSPQTSSEVQQKLFDKYIARRRLQIERDERTGMSDRALSLAGWTTRFNTANATIDQVIQTSTDGVHHILAQPDLGGRGEGAGALSEMLLQVTLYRVSNKVSENGQEAVDTTVCPETSLTEDDIDITFVRFISPYFSRGASAEDSVYLPRGCYFIETSLADYSAGADVQQLLLTAVKTEFSRDVQTPMRLGESRVSIEDTNHRAFWLELSEITGESARSQCLEIRSRSGDDGGFRNLVDTNFDPLLEVYWGDRAGLRYENDDFAPEKWLDAGLILNLDERNIEGQRVYEGGSIFVRLSDLENRTGETDILLNLHEKRDGVCPIIDLGSGEVSWSEKTAIAANVSKTEGSASIPTQAINPLKMVNIVDSYAIEPANLQTDAVDGLSNELAPQKEIIIKTREIEVVNDHLQRVRTKIYKPDEIK